MRLVATLALPLSSMALALMPSLARAEEPSLTPSAALTPPAPSPAEPSSLSLPPAVAPPTDRASPGARYYTIPAVAPSPGNSAAVDDPETPEAPTRSYGGAVLGIDMVAYVSAVTAGHLVARHRTNVPENLPVALAGGAGLIYLIGSPVLHLAKGHPGKGLGSLALRAGFVAAGTVPLALLANRGCGGGVRADCETTTLLSALFGAVLVTPIGTALDATRIAREPVAPGETARSPAQFAWTLAPLVDPRTRSYGASWRGVAW